MHPTSGSSIFSAFSPAILRNYFIISIRNLYKHKYFSIVNAIGLAVGMSVSLLIITIFLYVKTYDNFHANKSGIYRVITSYSKGDQEFDLATAPASLAAKLKSNVAAIRQVAHITTGFSGEVVRTNMNIPIRGFYTTSEFLSIFSFELEEGNSSNALSRPNCIIITRSVAKRVFGKEQPLGKIIEVHNQGSFEVTGVLKDPPKNTHFGLESLISSTTLNKVNDDGVVRFKNPFSYGSEYVYLLVQNESHLEHLGDYLSKLSKEDSQNSAARIDYHLQALKDITPGPKLTVLSGGVGPQWDYESLYIFGTISLLILLPACFNYMNISIARAVKRAKEIGLRKTMGSHDSQIFFQFIIETVILALISLLVALILFFLVRSEFQSLLVFAASLDLSLTSQSVGIFILFAIATGLIAGGVPALYFARLNPIMALKSQSSKVFSGMLLRKGLVILQFSLSFGFIVALIVSYKQYQYSINFNFGFQRENIVDIQLQDVNPERFALEYSKLSSVNGISFSSNLIGLRHSNGDSWMRYENQIDSSKVNEMFVDNHYIDNLELRLIAGANFPEGPWNKERFLIVNEQFLQMFKIANAIDAIGKTVHVNGLALEIVGVLKDFHFSSLRFPIKPFVFRMNPGKYQIANLKVLYADKDARLSEMKSLWKTLESQREFQANFFTEEIDDAYAFYNVLMKLTAFLGFLAISITLLGMLGMVVFTSETRAKEVGIRKVLGSSVAGVAFLLSKDYLKLMALACALGVTPSVLIIDWMLSELQYYSVRLTMWDILGGMITLIALGLLSISAQTVKTAGLNPVLTLKNE